MKLGASRAAAITVLVREHHGDGICDDEPRRDCVRARFLDHVLRKRSNDPQGGAASLRGHLQPADDLSWIVLVCAVPLPAAG